MAEVAVVTPGDGHRAPRGEGARLAELLYRTCVAPILDEHVDSIPHAAGLLDQGSEVLGYDDEMSTDHHWGPRVLLFVRERDADRADAIRRVMSHRLPVEIDGVPTHYTPDPAEPGTRHPTPITEGPVDHRVEVHTVPGFFDAYLGVDVTTPLTPVDWLSVSEQRLRTVTSGPIFHDDIGLGAVRDRFEYYPRDVWLYQLASAWTRIGQDEHLMGRAGIAGDELGSAVIGARLVRDLMRLTFLMSRRYAPYAKWFGTAFGELPLAETLMRPLTSAMQAPTWDRREAGLVEAYEIVAAAHGDLGLTREMPTRAMRFHGHPFRVIAMHGFARALADEITDPTVRGLTTRPLVGGLDLVSDSTDLVDHACWRPWIRALYRADVPGGDS